MSEGITIKGTRVFVRHRACFKPIVIHRGGARSSKTYSIVQSMVMNWLQTSETGSRQLILRKTLPSLKKSVYESFKQVLLTLGKEINDQIIVEKKELNYRFGKALIHFDCCDDVEKFKSSEWNDIMLEEATDFAYEDLLQLQLRTSCPEMKLYGKDGKVYSKANQVFLSFNPIDENHWIKTVLMAKHDPEEWEEIASTYKDNPYLAPSYVRKPEKLVEQNPSFARIYSKGEWGKLENIIFNNWDVVSSVPEDVIDWFGGIDFGLNSPMVLLEIGVKGRDMYVSELFYETGYTVNRFGNEIPALLRGRRSTFPMYADSANPDGIKTLKECGLNIKKAKKGNDSIKGGIDYLRTFNIHLVSRDVDDEERLTKKLLAYSCENTKKEICSYSWKKKGELILDEPVDMFNHSMDALRYGAATHLRRGRARFSWIDGITAEIKEEDEAEKE